jgi:hypothetical protein
MSDTTNLADLPSDPAVAVGSQNVVLQTTDKPTTYDPNVGISSANASDNANANANASASVGGSTNPNSNNGSSEIQEQKMMNELISGIQQASANGGTGLPSRDIPTNTVHFADDQVKPNYVPQQEQSDYIHNTDTEQDILARRVKNQNSRDSLEILYDEFQIPIIIGLLYFIFQLPIVKSKVLAILPSLFNKDGNPNLTGYIINSVFFGLAYYVISKTLVHLQNV